MTGRPGCAGADPELFFTDTYSEQAVGELTDTASRYCRTCPTLAACAAMADEYRMTGLFGGTLRTEGRSPRGWEKSLRPGCSDYAWLQLIPEAPAPDPVAMQPWHKGRWAS